MTAISLTDFVDVVSAAGTPKITKVRRVKHRGPYSPAQDFYKPFREHLINIHQAGGSRKDVRGLLKTLSDAKKQTNYPPLVDGYDKWWGRKTLVWFDPISDSCSGSGIDVRVNPELGLEVNGTPHLVKLYLKADPLTKNRVELITHLMEATLSSSAPNALMSVLDVRRKKLITGTGPNPALAAAVLAELAYIATLWPNV